MNSLKQHYPPAPACIICNKTQEEVGGKRIVGSPFRSVFLSDNPDPVYSYKIDQETRAEYPSISQALNEQKTLFVKVRGEKEMWTKERIEKAVELFKKNLHPWFCQVCANRTCSECGSPSQWAHGCDSIYDNGDIRHSAMFPIPPGCINTNCKEHR